ncbi:MAG TPA: peroxiredoxin family protein, partial [Zeimonas sp.]
MNLAPLLDTYWFWLESGLPDEARMALQQELDRLHAASWLQSALRAGDVAPDFALPDSPGGAVHLHDLLREGPVVLKFYRGRWCAFCTLELRAYARSLPAFRASGAEVIAVSPQTDEEAALHRERDRLPLHLLTDAHNDIARRFGIVYRVS